MTDTQTPDEEDEELKALIAASDVLNGYIGKIKTKYKGKNMRGRMTCPMCKIKGAMKVTLFQYRGHGRIRMFCQTVDCIRLME